MRKQGMARLITFGNGGHQKYYNGRCKLSGYDRPDDYEVHPHEDEGAVLLNKLPALQTEAGFKWVFAGPMVNVDLEDGECLPCPDTSGIMATALKESGNNYGRLLQIHEAAPKTARGSLDEVSIAEYVAGWVERGAISGRVVDGVIVWDHD